MHVTNLKMAILVNAYFLFHKKFAEWQNSELGQRALPSFNSNESPGQPFNNLSVNPFTATQNKTENQILDYEKNLCFR